MGSAVIILLGAEKLTGQNYANWKNTINTVLVIDDLKFVLIEECPPLPAQMLHEMFEMHLIDGLRPMIRPECISWLACLTF